jgi:flagellar basal-body rod protein FlgB
MRIDESIMDRMSAFLDFAARRQEAITSNLANSETPGYRAKTVPFADFLASEMGSGTAMRRTSELHLKGKPRMIRSEDGADAGDTLGNDGNNVDLDREMTGLAQNVMKFSVVGRLLQQRLLLIRAGIKEGRV